ncbi:3-oxoacyl-ACP synthase [Neolewinella aurantiaca]|uniref:3-oxoacyl-ACP synthase n=1 Tax=Neolewinella aurantiaca TaxID=2602767 RepID=A0A5C7FQI8_9BACT|nr:3-oxoacyl-ACP synthase [Neolewinella aurantiaca]TXF87636.1 3-oxoacyl-ACP synthase [Neolewinella aurantiaca]
MLARSQACRRAVCTRQHILKPYLRRLKKRIMEEAKELKQQLLAYCQEQTAQRIAGITDSLKKIEDARNGETKSSAGDKFETGRAMMQMEEAKLNRQLEEVLKVRQVLDRINPLHTSERVAAGTLVATNRGNYFLAVGLGKVRLEGRAFFCTSLDSPIGKQLHGKNVGDVLTFNDLEFKINGMV